MRLSSASQNKFGHNVFRRREQSSRQGPQHRVMERPPRGGPTPRHWSAEDGSCMVAAASVAAATKYGSDSWRMEGDFEGEVDEARTTFVIFSRSHTTGSLPLSALAREPRMVSVSVSVPFRRERPSNAPRHRGETLEGVSPDLGGLVPIPRPQVVALGHAGEIAPLLGV